MAEGRAVRLLLTGEGDEDRELTVTLPVVLGRDPAGVDVLLVDRMVSRRHARLEVDGDRVVLVDLGSANGTWVGDEKVERRPLAPDEAVTVGSHILWWAPVAPPALAPRPDYGAAWGIVVDDTGLRAMPLAELDADWVGVVHRAEALERFLDVGAVDDAAALLAAHGRFAAALDDLLDEHLDRLAPPTIAICAPRRDVAGFRARVAWMRSLPDHDAARGTIGLAATETSAEVARTLLAEDRRVVEEIVDLLRDAVRAFDEHTVRVATDGAAPLMTALKDVLLAVVGHESRLAAQARVRGPVGAG
jgi:hypothetical protein